MNWNDSMKFLETEGKNNSEVTQDGLIGAKESTRYLLNSNFLLLSVTQCSVQIVRIQWFLQFHLSSQK